MYRTDSIPQALLCLANGTLTGRQIVCMGDDDFVSLAIGFLLKELYPDQNIYPTHIHVLEMDGRYIECLNRLSGRFALPISCEQVDLRMPLPPHLCGRFDCLFTDRLIHRRELPYSFRVPSVY